MKLIISYLCELCQTTIAQEKIRSNGKDGVFIEYDEDKQFCEQCKKEMQRFEKNGVVTPVFWVN